MPYRVDLSCPSPDGFDRLVELGALDVEPIGESLAAILPDSVSREMAAAQLGGETLTFSAAVGRDDGSIWMLRPRSVRAGGLVISFADEAAPPGALRLTDGDAFGTGHHPTTALCLEALEEIITGERPGSVLDVGTGSGILALAALMMGVPRSAGLDIDPAALNVAEENARSNHLADRVEFILGRPDRIKGQWPVVVANILAAPLMEMAPVLVRHLETRGRLILSGIHFSLAAEVRQTYQHHGVRFMESKTRDGWTLLTAQAPW